MTRSKSIIGALVLCALSICAFGASSAFATEGLTSVECVEVASGKFETNHCETNENPGHFETVPFELNKSTAVSAVAPSGGATLHGTLFGLNVTITCTGSSVSGQVTNVTPGAEMQSHGTEGVTKYSGCTAHLSSKTPAEESCEIESVSGTAGQKGVVETNKLTSTTQANHIIKVKAETAAELAKFKILKAGLNCTIPATTVTVTGEATAVASTEKHGHFTFIEAEPIALLANSGKAQYTATYVGFTTSQLGKTTAERNTVGLTTLGP